MAQSNLRFSTALSSFPSAHGGNAVDTVKRTIAIATLALFLLSPLPVFARGGGRGHGGGHSSGSHSSGGHKSSSNHSGSPSGSVHRSPSNKSGSHSHSYKSGSQSHGSHSGGRKKSTAPGVKRDSHGKIKRSEEAKREFMKQSGYPHGRQGYVVDHVVPLKRGGSDTPRNMQWQTKDAAKAKDRRE